MSEQWKQTQLGKVCEIILGQSPSSDTYNQDRIGLPFFQGKSEFGRKYAQAKTWCSEPLKIANKNDILISVRAPVGESNLAPDYCCIGRGLSALRADQKNLLQEFLWHQIEFKKGYLQGISQGSTFDAISGKDLSELEIDIPPLPEQKKIAEILSGMEIVIENTNNEIAKLRKSKVTLLHAFFQERSDGQAGIATLGGEVIRKRFGDCLGIISGKGFEAKDYSASGTRLLRIDNVSWEIISWESIAYLPENIVIENQKLLLAEGDILLALNRPITQDKLKIARCSKGDLPAILYQRVGKIFTLDESTISNDFAYYLLQGILPDFIASQSVGSDQPFINLTALRELMLPLPQTDLQEKIVETLKSIDNSTAIHSKKVCKFVLLKKSLSSDLLSGRKRVSI